MYALEIVRWATVNPLSPGWLTCDQLTDVLNNPGSIQPEFYDEQIIQNYIDEQLQLQIITAEAEGVIHYDMTPTEQQIRYSVLAFENLAEGNSFEVAREAAVTWGSFVSARTSLLNLFQVTIEIFPMQEYDVSDEDFVNLTNSKVESWLA